MLIIEIALGIVLGFILLANIDKLIAILGAGIVIALYAGLVSLVIGGFVWFVSEKPNEVIAITIIVVFFVTVGAFGALIAKKTRLTSEEATGSFFLLIIGGFAIYSMWEKYQKYGDISEEVTRISPFLLLLLISVGILAKRVHTRSKIKNGET